MMGSGRRTLVYFSSVLLLLGVTSLWLPDIRFREVIAPTAYAQEGAPLAAMAELIKRKGSVNTLDSLCDGLGIRKSFRGGSCAVFGISGELDNNDLTALHLTYPKDWKATFQTFIDQSTGLTLIILASVSGKGTAGYAFLTDVSGALKGAAYAPEIKNSTERKWSSIDITPEAQSIFSRELKVWTSAYIRDQIRTNFPDRDIELEHVYSFEIAVPPGHYNERIFTGLEAAKSIRFTLSVKKQEKDRHWDPGVEIFFVRDIDELKDTTIIRPNLEIAGSGAMQVTLKNVVGNKIITPRHFKRTLSIGQKLNLEVSWRIPGQLSVVVDGAQEEHLPITRKIGVLKISTSTGTFLYEDMVFHQ